MKKRICVFLCAFLLLCSCVIPCAADDAEQELSADMLRETETQAAKRDSGLPKLIITDYKAAADALTPGVDTKLFVTVQNPHKTADAFNIKLIFSSPDGSLLPSGTDSVYIEKLGSGEKYIWNFSVTAGAEATSGKHAAAITAEYETADGESCSAIGSITLCISNPPKEEPAVNSSQPRLMVTAYTVENDSVKPGEDSALRITVKNMSREQAVKNIKLSLTDESGELRFGGMGSTYVNSISAGDTYAWETSLTAIHTAAVGEHSIGMQMDYESASGNSYNACDVLRIAVRQTVELDFDGATLPTKAVQGDTVTVTVNLMNTGKSDLHNCKVCFAVSHLSAGGSVFAGDIAPGENKSVNGNLRVDSDFEGNTSGRIIISYEDDFGVAYEKTADVSTLIEKKVEKAEVPEKTQKKNSLWWLFVLIGILAGGGAGAGCVVAVYNAKQRREDEKRL